MINSCQFLCCYPMSGPLLRKHYNNNYLCQNILILEIEKWTQSSSKLLKFPHLKFKLNLILNPRTLFILLLTAPPTYGWNSLFIWNGRIRFMQAKTLKAPSKVIESISRKSRSPHSKSSALCALITHFSAVLSFSNYTNMANVDSSPYSSKTLPPCQVVTPTRQNPISTTSLFSSSVLVSILCLSQASEIQQ